MQIPSDRRYTPDHEWVQIVSTDPDGTRVRVGLSDFAQDQLGDIVYVDLPAVGTEVNAGDPMAEVESTKSVGEVFAPLDGRIVTVNEALADAPQAINDDPYGAGWVVELVIADVAGFEALLDAEGYGASIA